MSVPYCRKVSETALSTGKQRRNSKRTLPLAPVPAPVEA